MKKSFSLRGWLDHCLSLKMISVDPLAEVKPAKMPRTGGRHPWEIAECELFERRHAIGTRRGWPTSYFCKPVSLAVMSSGWAASISAVAW
ncbi:hypothetical protein [Bradyrhizobium sp. USDA 4341]